MKTLILSLLILATPLMAHAEMKNISNHSPMLTIESSSEGYVGTGIYSIEGKGMPFISTSFASESWGLSFGVTYPLSETLWTFAGPAIYVHEDGPDETKLNVGFAKVIPDLFTHSVIIVKYDNTSGIAFGAGVEF